MASLIEELISTLDAEKAVYEELVPVSEQKTKVLVKEDLQGLKDVTAQEQLLIDRAGVIGHKREEVIKNIGLVLNMKPEELDITTLARILAKQPEEKQRLAALHDSLRVIMKRLVDVNERNKELIENSLEMVEFNLNFIQSTRMSPGNNNYNRNATNSYTSDYGTHVLMQSSSSYFQAGNMLVWTSTNWFPEDIRVFCFNKLLWRIQIWEVYLQALM